nr:MAG TPA: hypothetical protein [Caudoviricetes sp.]
MEMQFRKPLLQVFVQHYPAAKLGNGTATAAMRKVLLRKFGQVDCFHDIYFEAKMIDSCT